MGTLERAGVIYREPLESGRGFEYLLTQAGKELEPIIVSMAVWGQHWSRDMVNDDLDPAFLVWDMHLRMNAELMPEKRTVIEFDFSGIHAGLRRFWLVSEKGHIDMCLKYPGYDSDIVVRSDIRAFIECWRGICDLWAEIVRGKVKLEGPKELRQAFPDWMRLHVLAEVPRMTGREQAFTLAAACVVSARYPEILALKRKFLLKLDKLLSREERPISETRPWYRPVL